jgi:hypothetical protein
MPDKLALFSPYGWREVAETERPGGGPGTGCWEPAGTAATEQLIRNYVEAALDFRHFPRRLFLSTSLTRANRGQPSHARPPVTPKRPHVAHSKHKD